MVAGHNKLKNCKQDILAEHVKNLYKTNKKANNSYKNKFLGQSITMVQSAQEQNTYNRSAILNQTDDVITDDMTDFI